MQRKNKTYSYTEALEASKKYFAGDELAATAWLNKYAMKNREGELLEHTPDDMHKRMAREFARIERKYANSIDQDKIERLSKYGKKRPLLGEEKIYALFKDFKYVIPQGSVMAGLGNKNILVSLSNCVVLPEMYDSYGGIFYTDQQLAQLFKRRCGVGLDISSLRPSEMRVANAAGSTSGAVSFMERFSNTTREVSQHGRRGALMITMDIRHPDIEEFVISKQDLNRITGANISVRISDGFINAVINDQDFNLKWPVDSSAPEITKTVRARSLWEKIINCAHHSAEPGILFWDRQHHYSTSSIYPGFKNVSTNPCSEIAMQGGDSCRLIALNLFSLVQHPFTGEANFDFNKFYEIVYESQRLSDNLIDLELEAVDRILEKVANDPEPTKIKQVEVETWQLLKEQAEKGRRTGLGFTALADTLAALDLKFDSDEALEMTESIMITKCRAEFDSSIDLAIERGKFEAFDPDIEKKSGFVKMLLQDFPETAEKMMKYGRRNISISTVAPTGTLSLLSQTSSGIEPVFMLHYKRRKKVNPGDAHVRIDFKDDLGDVWQEYEVHHPKLDLWMKITGENDPEKSPYNQATASEINWQKRLEMQAIVQKYTTHSISSTINLPESVPPELVGEIYMEAWKQGLKGITVYREGARSGVLISADKHEMSFKEIHAPERPQTLDAEVVRFHNNQEKWIAVVGLMNGRPYEIFTGRAENSLDIPDYIKNGWVVKNRSNDGSRYDFVYMEKDGRKRTAEGLSATFDPEYWNYAKLISGVLRHGMPLLDVVDLVDNLSLYSDFINTWKNGVVRALKKYIPAGTHSAATCPVCDDPDGLIYEEGCLKCKSCGYSRC